MGNMKITGAFVLGLLFFTAVVFAQTPDLSGRWKLDARSSSSSGGGRGRGTGGGGGQGGGLALGAPADQVTIVEDAGSVKLEEHWPTGGSSHGVLSLDGKKVNGPVGAGRGLPATSASAWSDGRLVTALSVTAPDGAIREYQETRYLDEHGRLVVETTAVGRPNSRKSVYIKK